MLPLLPLSLDDWSFDVQQYAMLFELVYIVILALMLRWIYTQHADCVDPAIMAGIAQLRCRALGIGSICEPSLGPLNTILHEACLRGLHDDRGYSLLGAHLGRAKKLLNERDRIFTALTGKLVAMNGAISIGRHLTYDAEPDLIWHGLALCLVTGALALLIRWHPTPWFWNRGLTDTALVWVRCVFLKAKTAEAPTIWADLLDREFSAGVDLSCERSVALTIWTDECDCAQEAAHLRFVEWLPLAELVIVVATAGILLWQPLAYWL